MIPKSKNSLTKLTPEFITKILMLIIKKSSSVFIFAVQSKVPREDGVKIKPMLLNSFDFITNFFFHSKCHFWDHLSLNRSSNYFCWWSIP